MAFYFAPHYIYILCLIFFFSSSFSLCSLSLSFSFHSYILDWFRYVNLNSSRLDTISSWLFICVPLCMRLATDQFVMPDMREKEEGKKKLYKIYSNDWFLFILFNFICIINILFDRSFFFNFIVQWNVCFFRCFSFFISFSVHTLTLIVHDV